MCKDCQHAFHEGTYSFVIRDGEPFYKTKNGMHLKCPVCTSYNLRAVEAKGEYCTTFSVFGSLSNAEKRAALQRRSREHSKKHLAECKTFLDKNFTGSLSNLKGL